MIFLTTLYNYSKICYRGIRLYIRCFLIKIKHSIVKTEWPKLQILSCLDGNESHDLRNFILIKYLT